MNEKKAYLDESNVSPNSLYRYNIAWQHASSRDVFICVSGSSVKVFKADKVRQTITTMFTHIGNTAVEDIKLLTKAVTQQHKMLEYKDLYISFLSGLVTEDEFDKSAPSFIQKSDTDIIPELLEKNIERLMDLTQLSFSSLELKDIFSASNATMNSVCKLVDARRQSTNGII